MTAYRIYVPPPVWREIKQLPSNMRLRIKRLVDGLRLESRPYQSKRLDYPDDVFELRRIRIASWRVVYAIDVEWKMIYILAVRKRPPYDYDDLATLIEQLI